MKGRLPARLSKAEGQDMQFGFVFGIVVLHLVQTVRIGIVEDIDHIRLERFENGKSSRSAPATDMVYAEPQVRIDRRVCPHDYPFMPNASFFRVWIYPLGSSVLVRCFIQNR
jgi:hypothetical protein